ncbi:hypothetical protein FRC17_007376, partial [Serendipita sp. 399]
MSGIASIQYSAGLNLCIITVHPSFTLGAVVPPAFFDCVLFLLTLARAIRDARNKVISLTPKRGILSILYRDGVYYFTVLFAVHVWNVATYSMSSTGNFPSVYFAWSIMVVMSSRVYLNLIVAASGRSSDDEPTSYLPSTFEDNQRNAAGINPHNETEIIFAENTRSTDVPLTVFTSAFSIETVVPTARGVPHEMSEEERNIVLALGAIITPTYSRGDSVNTEAQIYSLVGGLHAKAFILEEGFEVGWNEMRRRGKKLKYPRYKQPRKIDNVIHQRIPYIMRRVVDNFLQSSLVNLTYNIRVPEQGNS